MQVQALEQAYDYWEKFQFDIIAAKVLALALQTCTASLIDNDPDAGLRRLRAMASEILCPKMGGTTSRADTVPIRTRFPTGPMGLRTLQPGGIHDA